MYSGLPGYLDKLSEALLKTNINLKIRQAMRKNYNNSDQMLEEQFNHT